jgi:hypothetical protein
MTLSWGRRVLPSGWEYSMPTPLISRRALSARVRTRAAQRADMRRGAQGCTDVCISGLERTYVRIFLKYVRTLAYAGATTP